MEDLRHVAMDNARFTVEIMTAKEETQVVVARDSSQQSSLSDNPALVDKMTPSYYWTAAGADRVEFYLSANIGEHSRPLRSVASGGELSRLMLTLRTICRSPAKSQDEFRNDTILIFDEVDTGIGGRVAETVGRRLKSLAVTQQVLCVTHQPQIARFADHHYAIAKHVEEGRTITQIKELSGEDRITGITRMLGASKEVMIARETSQWLLKSAGEETSFVSGQKGLGRSRTKKDIEKS